jgi:hypothetical protein
MADRDYGAAWLAYQQAVTRLYGHGQASAGERGAAALVAGGGLGDPAQAVIDCSEGLGQAAALGLARADTDERELAALQLMAAAACDLAIANDLVLSGGVGIAGEAAERGTAGPAVMAELQTILSAPLELGLSGLIQSEQGVERAGGPLEVQAARQALLEAVNGAVDDIRDDAAGVARVALLGLRLVPASAMRIAASVVAYAMITELSDDISAGVRKASGLLVSAIDKVLKPLGRETSPARIDAARWIDTLKGSTLFGALLDRLYESERIQEDVAQQVWAAPSILEAATFNSAGGQVSLLATKFRKHKSTITWVARGLAVARFWAVGLEPWGPLALTAAYLATIGYTVYLGGDYVDWYRLGASGRLGLAAGVRTVVRQTLAQAVTQPRP